MVIVLDIETRPFREGVVDPEKDTLVVLGVLEENGRKHYYTPKNIGTARFFFKKRWADEPIVGHNLKGFDIIVLKRYGFDFSNRVVIDTYDILKTKKRASAMMYADLDANGGHGLANCCKYFKLDVRKIEDFDYSVLSKSHYSTSEWDYIIEYLSRDLDASKALYDYIHDTFIGIKGFMSPEDQESYAWLTTTAGSCVYKVVCYQAGLPEEYDDSEHQDYPGAYVHTPSVLEAHDHVYSFDFKSLYPHCMMMLNVFGNTNNPSDAIESIGGFKPKGLYSKSRFGKISSVLQEMFRLKDKYEREGNKAGRLATKIFLNVFYGASGNPVFKSLYDPVSAEDTTQLGQYFVRQAMRYFDEQGYKVLYGDTDSVYVQDPYGDVERAKRLALGVTRKLNSQAAFPQETFSLALENEIRDIYFFREDGVFKKKYYAYVTTDGELTVKGMPVIKRDRCELSKRVFSSLKEQIISERRIRFPREYLEGRVSELFTDAKLAGKVLFVKPLSEYKSGSSLQAQASKRWGHGRHLIIPVVKGDYKGLEIGRGSMYLRLQDFIKLGVPLGSVRLDHVYKDLAYFVEEL